jgi:hypothetical protein
VFNEVQSEVGNVWKVAVPEHATTRANLEHGYITGGDGMLGERYQPHLRFICNEAAPRRGFLRLEQENNTVTWSPAIEAFAFTYHEHITFEHAKNRADNRNKRV